MFALLEIARIYKGLNKDPSVITIPKIIIIYILNIPGGGGGEAQLSEISYTDDPPIYDITSCCRVAALFSREMDARCYLVSSLFLPTG